MYELFDVTLNAILTCLGPLTAILLKQNIPIETQFAVRSHRLSWNVLYSCCYDCFKSEMNRLLTITRSTCLLAALEVSSGGDGGGACWQWWQYCSVVFVILIWYFFYKNDHSNRQTHTHITQKSLENCLQVSIFNFHFTWQMK